MKKYILIFSVLVLAAGSLFAQAPQKLGYVDSQVIFAQFPEAVKVQGDLDALFKSWNAVADSMTMELQQDYADLQKQAATMTDAKKQEAQKKLIEAEQKITEYKKQKFAQGGEAYQKQDQLLRPVKEKIIKAINDVAKDEKMQFVFDKTGDAFLLYADSAFDITYTVLDKLKRGK